MIEILPQAVNCHDHPVCVAVSTGFESRCGLSDGGFLSKRDNAISEAAEFAGHKLVSPLHFLVSTTFTTSY